MQNKLRVRAPEFGPGAWLNLDRSLTMESLRGRVVLVDIWEYSRLNWLRTLPYLREWQRRYQDQGLTIVGVHAPEFPFGREKRQVEMAVEELGIAYPVLLDNEHKTWDAFANRYWPAKYLIDRRGYIRHEHFGEGGYGAFEAAIQAVLREDNGDLELPPVMTPLRAEDRPGAVCYRPTPHLATGLFYGALGNPEGYAQGAPILYQMPAERPPHAFYVAGAWQAGARHLSYQGQNEGIVQLPYEAAEVNAVMTPHVATVERMLNPNPVSVEVWQDGRPLSPEERGADLTEDGRVLVERPRLFNLVRNSGFEQHEITLRVKTRGFALYAFTFTGCVKTQTKYKIDEK